MADCHKERENMKLLVFSDSHSNSYKIKEAIELHCGRCDAIIFLGDGFRDICLVKEQYPHIPFYIVKGNCDFLGCDAQDELLLSLDGVNLFITHGHKYGAKGGYGNLIYRARELEADAVLFGHTHMPIDDVVQIGEKNIRIFNPGSIGYGGSFGVINTSGKVLITSHGKLQ